MENENENEKQIVPVRKVIAKPAIETFMTTSEVAKQLNTSNKVVLENARKCLPDKKIENGKTTFWSKPEITQLIEQLKTSNPNQHGFTGAVKGVSTELTPALKIRQAMLLMDEGYKEELEILHRKIEQAEETIKEQKPKVDIYNEYIDRKTFCNFTDAANYIGVSLKKLMSYLRIDYIYKNSVGDYRCFEKYNEYFALRPYYLKDKVHQQLLFNIKGLEFFKKKILDRIEREKKLKQI